jgi:hypothetical protein
VHAHRKEEHRELAVAAARERQIAEDQRGRKKKDGLAQQMAAEDNSR